MNRDRARGHLNGRRARSRRDGERPEVAGVDGEAEVAGHLATFADFKEAGSVVSKCRFGDAAADGDGDAAAREVGADQLTGRRNGNARYGVAGRDCLGHGNLRSDRVARADLAGAAGRRSSRDGEYAMGRTGANGKIEWRANRDPGAGYLADLEDAITCPRRGNACPHQPDLPFNGLRTIGTDIWIRYACRGLHLDSLARRASSDAARDIALRSKEVLGRCYCGRAIGSPRDGNVINSRTSS